MIVHILRMYNSNHPRTWDEILPYVQHSYNRDLHISTDHNPFQVGLGFQPLGPIDVALPLAVFKDKFVSADTDQSPQIHLDLEQTVTEYYSFPRSRY
jgi:hypothetical protein